MTCNSPLRLDVGYSTPKSDKNVKADSMNTTAAIKKRCASLGEKVEMTTFGTTGHSCGSNQARLLNGPIAIYERSKVTYHHNHIHITCLSVPNNTCCKNVLISSSNVSNSALHALFQHLRNSTRIATVWYKHQEANSYRKQLFLPQHEICNINQLSKQTGTEDKAKRHLTNYHFHIIDQWYAS